MEPVLFADGTTTNLGTIFSTLIGDLSTQFTNAVPTVAAAAGAIVVVMIGVPLVVSFFKRVIH